MSCRHRLNNYGLVESSATRPGFSSCEGGDVLFPPSLSRLVPRILATSAIPPEDGLCKHQKDFFAHLKPKALVVGVSNILLN